MKIFDDKFREIHGYQEGKIDAVDKESAQIALDYKKNVLKNLTSIDQNAILTRLSGNKYYVTRKYDGEYAIIFYQDGHAVTINRSGRTRRGIPCIDEAASLLRKAGVKQAVMPAEMYVLDEQGRKTRVNDLISALAHREKIGRLRLAVFDVVELDGKPFRSANYAVTWEKIDRIFSSGKLSHPVDMACARSGREVEQIYRKWVGQEGSEGLVVHSPTGMSFKIKPRHNVDVIVVGYAEGSGTETGQVRSMMTALISSAGKYQVMCRVGSGLHEKLRKELFRYFSDKRVGSAFAGMSNKYEPMVMVRPTLVIEISIGEIVTEIISGERSNFLLRLEPDSYVIDSVVSGYKLYAPVFERVRPDKAPDPYDTGLGQLENLLRAGKETAKRSEILLKDIFECHDGIVRYVIWRREGEFMLYISDNTTGSTQRELLRSSKLHELTGIYEKRLGSRSGCSRIGKALFISHRFAEYLTEGE